MLHRSQQIENGGRVLWLSLSQRLVVAEKVVLAWQRRTERHILNKKIVSQNFKSKKKNTLYLRDIIEIGVDIELCEMLSKVPDVLVLLHLGLVKVADVVVGPDAVVVDWPDIIVVVIAGPVVAHPPGVIVLVQQSQSSSYVTLVQPIS